MRIGARAEVVGFERRPLEAMVGVEAPTVGIAEHGEAIGDCRLSLGRERDAGDH